jgi:hypothetical protein
VSWWLSIGVSVILTPGPWCSLGVIAAGLAHLGMFTHCDTAGSGKIVADYSCLISLDIALLCGTSVSLSTGEKRHCRQARD